MNRSDTTTAEVSLDEATPVT